MTNDQKFKPFKTRDRDNRIRDSYLDLFDLPSTDLKAKIELPPEPIVKPEGAALPREKKGLFWPKQTRDGGPRRQGMPPAPGEPAPPTPPSKPKPGLPEDWKNEHRYPIGHTKSATARILGINRKTVGRWVTKEILDEQLSTKRISLESIKRLKESKKKPTNN